MTETIYSVAEFCGKGDPFFGGTAADWALYKTEDGAFVFMGATEAQLCKLVMAYFPIAAEAEKAGTAASTRKGLIFRPSRQTSARGANRTDFMDCWQQACRRGGQRARGGLRRQGKEGGRDRSGFDRANRRLRPCLPPRQSGARRPFPALENVWTLLRMQPKIDRAIRRRGRQQKLQERKLSRYNMQITNGTTTDDEGTIGYDRPLRTFFLQAFPDPETDECALWLGAFLEEYSTLESIIEAARMQGYEARGLTKEMMLAMLKEAGPPHPPSLGERLGIVR
ncbi:hypothetical protein [Sinorhizobium meliloti]|uniref:hypothetical protein n=1 Tax=Rhizobium meliloti TaxID=382 RepID=UPI001F15A31D|nr:hypothetical protein [Sinorhizobium meliloti]